VRWAELSDLVFSNLRRRLADLPGVAEANVFVILALVIPGVLMALRLRREIVQDAWYTLLGGRIVARSGLPHHNTLTVLAHGHAWVDQQWLGQLFFYGLWAAGGWGLSLPSVIALYLAAFAVLAVAARVSGASERSTALVTAIGLATGISNTVLRTQVAAYVLCAVVLVLLLRDELEPGRRVFAVLPILVLWANVHGSVLVGAGLVALHGASTGYAALRRRGEPLRRLIRPAALIALPWPCALISPYGFALAGYYRHFASGSALSGTVTEWAPSTVRSQPFFFVVLGAVLFVVFRQRGSLGPFAQLAVVATGIGGLLANRNIVWFALVAAAVVPRAIDELWPARTTERRPQANRAIVSVALFVLVLVAGTAATNSRAWFEIDYPQPAADVVAHAASRDLALRVYANEAFADWLLFEHPALDGRVSFDIRYELLSDQAIRSIAAFESRSGANWRAATSGYSLLVLSPNEPGVAYYRGVGAQTLYSDAHVVVLSLAGELSTPG
jgi:hypothetical protein